jgi:hypothetical protein
MDFDIEMGDAAQGIHEVPVEELPPADDILVLKNILLLRQLSVFFY